jgi:hypothetical protein
MESLKRIVGGLILLSAAVAAAQVQQPKNGGTGSGTAPTAGQIMVGQSTGKYAPETVGGSCTMDSSGALTCSGGGGGAGLTIGAQAAEPSPLLTTVLQALNNAANAPVSIVVAGDSFTICDHTLCGSGGGPTTSTNRWPEQIRIQLQGIYGSHGTGLVPIIWSIASNPSPVNSEAYSTTGTYDTSVTALGPTQSSDGTLVHLHSGATITFSDARSIKWDTLHVYGATTSSSGSLACTADGSTSLGTLTTGSASATGAVASGYTATRWDLDAISLATHSVVCTASGDFYLYAFDGTAGTSGVEVSAIGIGGAQSTAFGTTAADNLAFSDLILAGTQGFVFMIQTNDAAGSVSTTTFATNVGNVISHEQGLAAAPTMMLAIPPVDVVNGTDPMAPYTAKQVSLCSGTPIACINIQNRGTTVGSTAVGWGTTYNASSGLWDLTGSSWPTGNAGVHPNDAGTLDEAQMIYAALVNPIAAPVAGIGNEDYASLMGAITPTGCAVTGNECIVGSATPSITLAGIPGGYVTLELTCSAASTETGVDSTNVDIQINGDSGSNYDTEHAGFYVSSGNQLDFGFTNSTTLFNAGPAASSQSTNSFALVEVLVMDYTSTSKNKMMLSRAVATNVSLSQLIPYMSSGQWHPGTPAAITSLTIFTGDGHNWIVGTSCMLAGKVL